MDASRKRAASGRLLGEASPNRQTSSSGRGLRVWPAAVAAGAEAPRRASRHRPPPQAAPAVPALVESGKYVVDQPILSLPMEIYTYATPLTVYRKVAGAV